ncbi:MAG: hypothetical protein RL156_1034 [Bacteroidota bacterium]
MKSTVSMLVILACTLCVTSTLHAEQDPMPFTLSVQERISLGQATTVCIDSATGRSVALKHSAEPGSIHLSSTFSGKVVQATIQADSLLFASWRNASWYLLFVRSDTLYSAVLGFSRPIETRSVRSMLDVTRILRGSGYAALCTADSVVYLEPASSSQQFRRLHVYSYPRVIIAIKRAGADLLTLCSLSDNMASIERYANSAWTSLAASSVVNGIACFSDSTFYSLQRSSMIATNSTTTWSIEVRDVRGFMPTRLIPLPPDLADPLAAEAYADTAFFVFANGIVAVGSEGLLSVLHDASFSTKDIRIEPQAGVLSIADSHEAVIYAMTKDAWYRLRSLFAFATSVLPWLLLTLAFGFLFFRVLSYRQLLRDVLEHTSRGVSFVVDRNMKVRRMNNKARELFAMDSHTPLRRVLSYYCHSDVQQEVERFVASALVAREVRSSSIALHRSDSERELLFNAQPWFGIAGGFRGMVISGIDITEELERKRLVNWAQLAHDMQTNLSVIRLNAEQMDTSSSTPLFLDQRRRIIHQSKLLLQRVRDIVSIGRDEVLHAGETDLAQFYSSVVQEFDDSSFGEISFVVRVPKTPVMIRIDAPKLSRAVRNAVENAIRALPDKTGTIELGYQVQPKEFSLFVRDTGVGMDEQTQANFFRPYFSTYRQFGGTGIGTMIMQRAVALHGGHITLSSEVGAGTTVFFHLPKSVYAG